MNDRINDRQDEVFFDLETVPSQDPEVAESIRAALQADFKAPSDMTKERACQELGMTDPNEIKFTSKANALAMWVDRFRDEKLEETVQDELRKTSFDGGLGQIAVFGVALNDDHALGFYRQGLTRAEEIDLIRESFDYIASNYSPVSMRAPVFVGHNISRFDLPFLFKRCVVLGIKPPSIIPFGAKPWSDQLFDTMVRWDANKSAKLDEICRAVGVKGKTEGLDGSMVWPMIQAGEIEKVSFYCCDDVDATRNVYHKMTFQPTLAERAEEAQRQKQELEFDGIPF